MDCPPKKKKSCRNLANKHSSREQLPQQPRGEVKAGKIVCHPDALTSHRISLSVLGIVTATCSYNVHMQKVPSRVACASLECSTCSSKRWMLMKMLCYSHCYLRLVSILCLWVKGSQVPQYDTMLTDRAWRSESLAKFFSRVRCPWLGVHCAPPPQQETQCPPAEAYCQRLSAKTMPQTTPTASRKSASSTVQPKSFGDRDPECAMVRRCESTEERLAGNRSVLLQRRRKSNCKLRVLAEWIATVAS